MMAKQTKRTKKKATTKRSAPKRAAKKVAAKRTAPKRVTKKATAKGRTRKPARKTPKKRAAATVYTINVCSSWNGVQGSQVNFTNPTANTTCHITADGTWPFTDPSPFSVPPAGATTYLKPASQLPNSTYYYDVDCCTNLTRKSVTVP
jgi:hypothetical protein